MDEPKPLKKITDEKTGLAKAEHYCAYQERSQQEMRDKLYEWGLYPDAVEHIITHLLEGNFLNEERFALAYAHGKMNLKHWGKGKIKQGLKFKSVSDPLIKKALLSLNNDDYLEILRKVIDKKSRETSEKDPFKRDYKIKQYALSRGFEHDLILFIMKNSDL